MGKEHCQCSFPIISYIQSNDADCALSQTDERFVRMRKMQGAWIQGERSVLLRTRLSLYIQSNTADCALLQTDYLASFIKYTITGKWSL